jgi:hypothetical protein
VTRPDEPRDLRQRFLALDLASMACGLLALGVAVLYLGGELADRPVRGGAVAAYALGVLAVAGLLAGVRRALVDRDG